MDGLSAALQSVWVICPDNFSEGLGEPVAVCLDESSASEAMEFLKRAVDGYRSFRLMEVPVFPGSAK
jgi:hypothetical protein